MDIQIVIGINSNGEHVSILLNQEPNLFISYSDEEQLHYTFKNIIAISNAESNNKSIRIAYALSAKTEERIIRDGHESVFLIKFIRNEYREEFLKSKNEFWNKLMVEFRKRLKKISALQPGQKWQNTSLIVLIDDVFDMILSERKKTGLSFLELAVYGSEVGIHFVVASYGTYRNLLAQLIKLNPIIEKKLRENKATSSLKVINPLGSELILSAEGLKFYKEKSSSTLQRLYPEPEYPVFG